MSDKRNRLIAGRIRDAEKSSERLSAKGDMLKAAYSYMNNEEDDVEVLPRPKKQERVLKA